MADMAAWRRSQYAGHKVSGEWMDPVGFDACPFCAEDAGLWRGLTSKEEDYWQAFCDGCDASSARFRSRGACQKAWNRREESYA
jgi:hypothetical protein